MQLPPTRDTADRASVTSRRAAPAQPTPWQFDLVWSAILAPATPPLPAPIASPAPPAAATSTQQQSGHGRQRHRD